MLFKCSLFKGEWDGGLRHYPENLKDPNSYPTRLLANFGIQPSYEAPGDLRVEPRIRMLLWGRQVAAKNNVYQKDSNDKKSCKETCGFETNV